MRKFWLVFCSSLLVWVGTAYASEALTVRVAKATPVYFKGDDNRREQFMEVSLPESVEAYGRVSLNFKLSCPAGNCDRWDRLGSFGIMQPDAKGQNQYLELLRFITPYGIGASWKYDLSDFIPLLQGKKTFKIFIDTWVGPGHPQGNGWLVDAELVYEESIGTPVAAYVQPILSQEDVVYGDPSRTAERQGKVLPLLGYQSAQLYMVITGHGQGNAENCAEFCPKIHRVQIGSESFEKRIWRDDCATTVDPNQKGSWRYPRAGWCPGDKVDAWKTDITAALLGKDTEFRYQPEAFDNICRPSVKDCRGCVFGTSCDYDGGLHTEPRYYVSAYVIYYR